MDSDTFNIGNIQNVLIVRLGKIGDIITTSFVFEIFKKNFPNVHITLLTLKKNKDVLKHNPNLDEIVYTNKNVLFYFTLLMLRKKFYDLIVDFNDNPSSSTAMLFKLCRAKNKVSYDYEKYNGLLTYRIKPLPKETTHIIDRIRAFVEHIGLSIDEHLVKPTIYIGKNELEDVLDQINVIKPEYKLLSLNISAGAPIRYWRTSYWIEIIKMINKNYPEIKFLILASPEDKSIVNEIYSEIKNVFLYQKYFTFQHFAAYIKCSDFLISPDTSAIHIASAFGIPIVGLYPQSDWNFTSWSPFKTPSKTIQSKTEDIKSIEPTKVYEAFKELYLSLNHK